MLSELRCSYSEPLRFAIVSGIRVPERAALFLDIDGTLAELAPTPDEAIIPEATRRDMARLHEAFGGALALVSGRRMADIDHLCAPYHFAAAAQHGLEIRFANDALERPEGQQSLNEARTVVAHLHRAYPLLFIEDKGLSLAVHFRQAPEMESTVLETLRQLAQSDSVHLCIQEGKMVAELRLHGGDKGSAIQRLLSTPPFQGRTPLFAGDDRTDEHAFRAVNALGGITIKIGEGETEAQHRLENVSAMHLWLAELAITTPVSLH